MIISRHDMFHVVEVPPERKKTWRDGLLCEVTRYGDRGLPRGLVCNVIVALENAPEWDGVFAWAESCDDVLVVKQPPFRTGREVPFECDDAFVTLTLAWFQRQYIRVSDKIVRQGIRAVARLNSLAA